MDSLPCRVNFCSCFFFLEHDELANPCRLLKQDNSDIYERRGQCYWWVITELRVSYSEYPASKRSYLGKRSEPRENARARRPAPRGFAARSRVLARLASLAQIGELARRLYSESPWIRCALITLYPRGLYFEIFRYSLQEKIQHRFRVKYVSKNYTFQLF